MSIDCNISIDIFRHSIVSLCMWWQPHSTNRNEVENSIKWFFFQAFVQWMIIIEAQITLKCINTCQCTMCKIFHRNRNIIYTKWTLLKSFSIEMVETTVVDWRRQDEHAHTQSLCQAETGEEKGEKDGQE